MKPEAKEILREVIKRLRAYPETYDQRTFCHHDPKVKKGDYPKNLCGTTACLAGHIVIAAGKGPKSLTAKAIYEFDWYAVAKKILGLDEDTAETLFDSDGLYWPSPFFAEWSDSTDIPDYTEKQRVQADIAARRLEHLIETGE